ncbi:MAG: type II toxin-antitoxin system RelE/ParE family toxin [Cyanobacteria bacterium J06641_5]
MDFSFHPDAEAELNHAIDYYEARVKGLGVDFANTAFSSMETILAHPEIWPILENEVRRCLLPRFPYGILYTVKPTEIFILSVMHLRKEPFYWRERLK